jgi:hypothetical protein
MRVGHSARQLCYRRPPWSSSYTCFLHLLAWKVHNPNPSKVNQQAACTDFAPGPWGWRSRRYVRYSTRLQLAIGGQQWTMDNNKRWLWRLQSLQYTACGVKISLLLVPWHGMASNTRSKPCHAMNENTLCYDTMSHAIHPMPTCHSNNMPLQQAHGFMQCSFEIQEHKPGLLCMGLATNPFHWQRLWCVRHSSLVGIWVHDIRSDQCPQGSQYIRRRNVWTAVAVAVALALVWSRSLSKTICNTSFPQSDLGFG